jgi:hypothetical protein
MTFELPKPIKVSIQDFTGRAWLLPVILAWFEQREEQLFILQGKPGTGKSMIAGWLAGSGPQPDKTNERNQLEYLRSRVKAVHYCQAASGNTAPKAFANNLAEQLTANLEGFADALVQTLGDQIRITTEQRMERVESGANVTGVRIERLDLGGLSDELSFDRVLREPLQKLYEGRFDEPIILLIDALDEAGTYTGPTNIIRLLAKLDDLPNKVRVLATSRPDPRVLKYYRDITPFDLVENAPVNKDDVSDYVSAKLAMLGEEQASRLAKKVSEAAEGIFLYAHLVTNNLLANPADLNLGLLHLPKGLTGLYHDFLTREVGANEDRWDEIFKPLLGLIAVAQGDGLNRIQLEQISGKDIEWGLRVCKQYLDGDLPDGPFRPFHKSFADYLFNDRENVDYHIDAVKTHQRIASYYWQTHHEDWERCDNYGLLYLSRHLYSAHDFSTLYEVLEPHFREVKSRRFFSDESFLFDIRTAIEAAEQAGLAALPRVMALSVGRAKIWESAANIPASASVTLAHLGAHEEALVRLQSLRPEHEVEGFVQIAALHRTEEQTEKSRAFLQKALATALDVRDEETRASTIQLALKSLEIEPDPLWVEAALEPVVAGAREFTSLDLQLSCLLDCVSQLARVRADVPARELLEECSDSLFQSGTSEPNLNLVFLTSQLWQSLGEPARAQQVLKDAVTWELEDGERSKVDGLNYYQLVVLILLGRVKEATEMVSHSNMSGLVFVADELQTLEDLDFTWKIVDQAASGKAASGNEIALVKLTLLRRMIELGAPESLMSTVATVREDLTDKSVGLEDLTAIRILLAERYLSTEKTRAKDLLAQALRLQQENDAQRKADQQLNLAFSEDILLRLADAVARVPDRLWAQGRLEDVLAVMLNQQPIAAFTRMHADEWYARARAAIGGRMAEIGATDRAKELIETALGDTAKIELLVNRRGPLGIIAEALQNVNDRAWVERMIRRLLSGQAIQPGAGDVQLAASLAEQMLDVHEAEPAISQILDQILGVITGLSQKLEIKEFQTDYELKESLTTDIQDVLTRLAVLLPKLDDKHKEKETLPLAWSLALRIDDLEVRRDLITKILTSWIIMDPERAEEIVHELERSWDTFVANATIAKLLSERGRMEEAIAAIDNVVEKIDELSWDEGLTSALVAIVESIPAEAEVEYVGGWLSHVLFAARDDDWQAWISARLIAGAQERLSEGDVTEANELAATATHLSNLVRDPVEKSQAKVEIASYHMRRGDRSSAEELFKQLLMDVAAIADPGKRKLYLIGIANKADIECLTLFSEVAATTGTDVRDEMLPIFAGRFTALGAANKGREIVDGLASEEQKAARQQIASGLAVAGNLDEAWHEIQKLPTAQDRFKATTEVAAALASAGKLEDALATADRISETEQYSDTLCDIVINTVKATDESKLDDALEAINNRLARLAGADKARAQALISRRLSLTGVRGSANEVVGSGGTIVLAADYMRALSETLRELEEDKQVEAYRQALVCLGGRRSFDKSDAALKYLLEQMEQNRGRAEAIGAVARKASEHESYDCLNGALRWLMAIETWTHRIFLFVVLANWIKDWSDFQSEYIKLGQTVALALGEVAEKLLEKNETTAAESVANLDAFQTTAYVQSRLANAMRRHQNDERANELLTNARGLLLEDQLVEWSEAYMSVAVGLVRMGRTEDAHTLIDCLKDEVDRNAVRDSIACALVEVGALEEAQSLVAAMEEQGYMDLYREEMIVHEAAAAVAEANFEAGDLEEAVKLLQQIDDPWAISVRNTTLENFGQRLADLAPTDPVRVSNLIFDLLRQVRVGGRTDVLTYVAALSPALKVGGKLMPLELWSQLKQVQMWS